MKLRMSMFAFLVMLALPGLVGADTYQGGTFKVASLRVAPEGIYVRFSPAPTACEGGDYYRMHALVPNSQSNFTSMTSTLLAAYTAENTLTYLWFSGEGTPCSSSHFLNLNMVELTDK